MTNCFLLNGHTIRFISQIQLLELHSIRHEHKTLKEL